MPNISDWLLPIKHDSLRRLLAKALALEVLRDPDECTSITNQDAGYF